MANEDRGILTQSGNVWGLFENILDILGMENWQSILVDMHAETAWMAIIILVQRFKDPDV